VARVSEIDRELALLATAPPAWRDAIGTELTNALTSARSDAVTRASRRIVARLTQAVQQLDALVLQAELIRFEIVDAEYKGLSR
jgi:hypothetical protein